MEKMLRGRGLEENQTLMQLMMGRSYIGPEDWRRQAAANDLEYNVAAMVRRCKVHHVPVIVCNQPSNERELATLGEDKLDQLDAQKRVQFERSFASAIESLAVQPAKAIESLKTALAVFPSHARAHFYLGKA